MPCIYRVPLHLPPPPPPPPLHRLRTKQGLFSRLYRSENEGSEEAGRFLKATMARQPSPPPSPGSLDPLSSPGSPSGQQIDAEEFLLFIHPCDNVHHLPHHSLPTARKGYFSPSSTPDCPRCPIAHSDMVPPNSTSCLGRGGIWAA